MYEDEKEPEGFDYVGWFKNKLDKLPLWRKIVLIICLLCILGGVTYLATLDKIQVVTYFDGCNETYINGQINGSYCENARSMIDKHYTPDTPFILTPIPVTPVEDNYVDIPTTDNKTQHVVYVGNCNETYIDNVLQGEKCPVATDNS